VASAVLSAYDSGDLAQAVAAEGGFKKWANALGKAQKRKGKRLFMPLRIALTVRMAHCMKTAAATQGSLYF
jgi:glutamyl-tRNA synthetase